MTISLPKISRAGFQTLGICLVIHLLTYNKSGKQDLVIALILLLLIVAVAVKKRVMAANDSANLSLILVAMASGFWVFMFFRQTGLVRWPMSHPETLQGYAMLLYYHFVLAVTVLSAVIMVMQITNQKRFALLNGWRNGLLIKIRWTLVLTASVFWVWAFYIICSSGILVTKAVIGLIGIAFLKALLNGCVEEICYRGLIQSVAEKIYGTWGGILFQAVIYTMFHMHLGSAFFSGGFFLASVFVLGLIFGMITRLTSGIGWTMAVHSALNMVVEWGNLSLISS